MKLLIYYLTIISGITNAANLLQNSSFECGATKGWSYGTSQVAGGPLSIGYVTSPTFHGNTAVRLEFSDATNSQTLVSVYYRLKSSTTYTVSWYASSPYSAADHVVTCNNTWIAPYGPGDTHTSGSVKATNGWQRFSFSFITTTNATNCTYQIIVSPLHQGSPGNFLYVDAFQLEAGSSATSYSPMTSVEAGIALSDHPGNLFYDDEIPELPCNLWNDTGFTSLIKLNYQVFDFWNGLVKEGNKTISLAPGAFYTNLDLSLSVNKLGSFRVLAWIDGIDHTLTEGIFSTVKPPVSIVSTNGMFGTHPWFKDSWLNPISKLGFKWVRTLSPGHQFRWNVAEPTTNNFVYFDSDIALATNYNLSVLATVGDEMNYVPSYALSTNNAYGISLPRISDWNNFVSNLVTHYSGSVKYWEIWNEPDAEGGLSSPLHKFYADLLTNAYAMTKAIDSSSYVVGMVTAYASYMEATFTNMPDSSIDIIATHLYPTIQQSFVDNVNTTASNHSKPVWNTEEGGRSDTFWQTIFWEDFYTSGEQPTDYGRDYRIRCLWPIWDFSRTFSTSIKKNFYYDARNATALDAPITYSIFDVDQSVRPLGVTISALAQLCDGGVSGGRTVFSNDTDGQVVSVGSDSVLIVWTTSTIAVKNLTTSLSQSIMSYFDIQGNAISYSGGIRFTQTPVYVKAVGTSAMALTNSITVTTGSDTSPPVISFVNFPTGVTSDDPVILRWFAVDDVSIWGRQSVLTNGMLFSSKLDGVDQTWSDFSNQRSSYYYGLRPGIYTFNVKAQDASGNVATNSIGFIKSGWRTKDLRVNSIRG